MLEEAEDDILAFYAFPSEHWPKLRSTNTGDGDPLSSFTARAAGRRRYTSLAPRFGVAALGSISEASEVNGPGGSGPRSL